MSGRTLGIVPNNLATTIDMGDVGKATRSAKEPHFKTGGLVIHTVSAIHWIGPFLTRDKFPRLLPSPTVMAAMSDLAEMFVILFR